MSAYYRTAPNAGQESVTHTFTEADYDLEGLTEEQREVARKQWMGDGLFALFCDAIRGSRAEFGLRVVGVQLSWEIEDAD